MFQLFLLCANRGNSSCWEIGYWWPVLTAVCSHLQHLVLLAVVDVVYCWWRQWWWWWWWCRSVCRRAWPAGIHGSDAGRALRQLPRSGGAARPGTGVDVTTRRRAPSNSRRVGRTHQTIYLATSATPHFTVTSTLWRHWQHFHKINSITHLW